MMTCKHKRILHETEKHEVTKPLMSGNAIQWGYDKHIAICVACGKDVSDEIDWEEYDQTTAPQSEVKAVALSLGREPC